MLPVFIVNNGAVFKANALIDNTQYFTTSIFMSYLFDRLPFFKKQYLGKVEIVSI